MKLIRHWTAAALAALLTASVLITPGLANPEESFADFRIDASSHDVPERTITVVRYSQEGESPLRPAGTTEYTCNLNRVTGDASFYIQPRSEGVEVVVDYLADLNGDGAYELMDSDSSPMRDTLNQKSILSAVTDGPCLPLTSGETYIVSAESLSSRPFSGALRPWVWRRPPPRASPCAGSRCAAPPPSRNRTTSGRPTTWSSTARYWSPSTSPPASGTITRWSTAWPRATSPAWRTAASAPTIP